MGIAVLGGYLWRDFHLTGREEKLPDVVVENLEVERVIDRRKWNIVSPKIEHRDGKIYGDSMDVTVLAESGDISTFYAESGVFMRKSGDIKLSRVTGSAVKGSDKISIAAGRADYDAGDKIWRLADGVFMSNDKFEIRGPSGLYDDTKGTASVTGGGTAKW